MKTLFSKHWPLNIAQSFIRLKHHSSRVQLILSVLLPAISLIPGGCTAGKRDTPEVAEPAQVLAFQLREGLLESARDYDSGKDGGVNSIVESLGGGAGVFDLEGDGRPDLYLPGGGKILPEGVRPGRDQILRLRNSAYVDQTLETLRDSQFNYSHGVTITDFENDGFDDVAVSGYGSITLLRNNGDGTLTEYSNEAGLTDTGWSSSLACGDLNLDGFSDLYVCHYVDWSLDNNPPCKGRNGQPDVCPPRSFNGLDDEIYFNSGDGRLTAGGQSFGLVKGGKGLGVLTADIDTDGDVDVYVANDTTENFLYRNDKTHLEEIGFSSGTALDNNANANGSMGVAVLDFDQNGIVDIFVANYEDEVFAFYENLGNLSFVHSSDKLGMGNLGGLFVGFGSIATDLDLDGDEDVVVNNGHVVHYPVNAPVRQSPLLLRNDKTGFTMVSGDADSYFKSPRMGRGLVRLDWNNDGKEDLLFRNSDEASCLVENVTETSGQSLKFLLRGVNSERHCVGATLTAHFSDGQKLIRTVYGGGSYLSHSENVVHFGIPADAAIDRVTIKWPGGKESVIESRRLSGFQLSGQTVLIPEPVTGMSQEPRLYGRPN
jgi:hypothetical protein